MCMSSLCLTSEDADTLEYVKRLIELKINLDSFKCKLLCVVPINHAAKQVVCQIKKIDVLVLQLQLSANSFGQTIGFGQWLIN